jgi:hypothetical protein
MERKIQGPILHTVFDHSFLCFCLSFLRVSSSTTVQNYGFLLYCVYVSQAMRTKGLKTAAKFIFEYVGREARRRAG